MDLRLTGTRAVVTGAADGIGAATARELAAEGAQLLLIGRRESPLVELAREIETGGALGPLVLPLDLAEPTAAATVLEVVQREWAQVDILVNNAGGAMRGAFDEEVWRASEAINFHAKRRLAEVLLPLLKASRRGRIINLIGSPEPRTASPAFSSVAATRAWAKGLSRDVARDGITVNCVAPGRVHSAQVSRHYGPDQVAAASAEIPMGRFGEADEVAAVIAFLASTRASYVTGESVFVDGGLRKHV